MVTNPRSLVQIPLARFMGRVAVTGIVSGPTQPKRQTAGVRITRGAGILLGHTFEGRTGFFVTKWHTDGGSNPPAPPIHQN